MKSNECLNNLVLQPEIRAIFDKCPQVTCAYSIDDLTDFSVKDSVNGSQLVSYQIPGKGEVKEAWVCRTRNGIAANYFEPYMRRRDPDSMLIGDSLPTDKTRYSDVHHKDFSALRKETFEWLGSQKLQYFAFYSGQETAAIPSLVIAPENAGFFALGLAELQGIIDLRKLSTPFKPEVFVFVAPPFRHTHFEGKQVVVHNRSETSYEIFSYNLYPGPSAKKGIYGALLHYGEKEGWLTAHAAAVQVVTPYDNRVHIMHEGASGGGKSEMNEHIHREFDGRIKFGTNLITGEKKMIVLPRGCNLNPITDDMALCHPKIQKQNGKLSIVDAENAWFIRVDHIKNYGTDPDIEARSIHPEKPMVFLNIDAQPGSTALLWDHIEDSPGKSCPNPRFILPRETVPDVISRPVGIDIRSFGVRTPPCSKESPSYGILGIFHILPPALAWLWRLVAPRGHDNPSIVGGGSMESEGIGSFWPFATGKKVTLANLMLRQIVNTPKTHYILCPVKHIGSWQVGFMPQWIMREYLARRGGVHFGKDELTPSRSSLLGYSMNRLIVEGQEFDLGFLQVEHQHETGQVAFDAGAAILSDYFKREASQYLTPELDPLGRQIIDAMMQGADVADLEKFILGDSIFFED